MEHDGEKAAEGREGGGDHTVIVPPGGGGFGEQPGDRIGPYKLLSVIGEGGFGTVWLAERREPYFQRVAIKIIKPGMDSKAVIARFEQERQALAVMDHPNVAKVMDGGVTPLGRPYFVMEHVKGEPITEFCDKHRQTIRQRLEMFIPVCEAVQHAHMKGIIHRDLKPSNILVSFMEAGGFDGGGATSEGGLHGSHGSGAGRGVLVKVIDFGVAKAINHTLTGKTLFTEHGQIIGTPEYMSPEQAEMGAVDVDTRTDVYSLGVVLYELLTGALPFDPSALRSKGYNEIQRIIREVDPPKPSTRLTSLDLDQKDMPPGTTSAADLAHLRHVRLGELVRELRRELDWVPLMAMRKDRRERYQSALAVAEDIGRYLRGEALVAGPESAAYRVRKFVKRHRAGVAGTAGLMVLLAGFGVVSFYQYRETAAAKVRADESAGAARREAYAANIAAAGANVELGNVTEALRRLKLCTAEPQGWEWGHLKWRADWSRDSVDVSSGVGAVGFTADGKGILVMTDEFVSVWDSALKTCRKRWSLKDAGVHGAEQARLVSVDEMGERALEHENGPFGVRVVRPGGAPEFFAPKLGPSLTGFGFEDSISPDGSRAYIRIIAHDAADPWPNLVLFDTRDRREIKRVESLCACWFEHGRSLLVSGRTHLQVYSAADGALKSERAWGIGAQVPGLRAKLDVNGMAAGEDGKKGLIADDSGVWAFDAEKGEVRRISGEPGRSVSVSADGRVGVWVVEGCVCACNLETGLVRRLRTTAARPTGAAVSADGGTVAIGSAEGLVCVLSLADDSPLDWTGGAFTSLEVVRSAAGSPDLLFIGGMPARPIAGRIVGVSSVPSARDFDAASWNSVELAWDGRVALGVYDGMVHLLNAGLTEVGGFDVQKVVGLPSDAEMKAHPSGQLCPPWAERFAFVGSSGVAYVVRRGYGSDPVAQFVMLFDPAAGKQRKLKELPGDMGASLAASRTGVLAAGAGPGLWVWGSPEQAARELSLSHGVNVLAFAGDGARLGVGCLNGSVYIVDDLAAGEAVELKGAHRGPVYSAAFTPDGSRLLTGSDDGTIIVWDVASHEALVSLNMGSRVLDICFPEGQTRGVAAMQNGSVRYLGVRP